ncbi:hypothetical protein AB0F77_06180 [Streptomyces sp. NPDC026672]|uniref:hypothetical protein n=1 Tax=unclassified Streptomyces TaxID=2593676 RepID=UPI0033D870D6
MKYALIDPTVRKAAANEYYNITTEEYEVVRHYGAYRVLESFLMPDGQVLVLAHHATASEPFAVGVHNASLGVYWSNGNDARRNYAWRIAESFGLTVDKEGSKAVVPASREYATTLVQQIKKTSEDLGAAVDDQDVPGLDRSAAGLRDAAVSLAKHLQRTGVLSETVYERWEVVG